MEYLKCKFNVVTHKTCKFNSKKDIFKYLGSIIQEYGTLTMIFHIILE